MVHRHAAKVVLEEDDNPDPNALDPQWFAVTTAAGRRHEITLDHVLGRPAYPLSQVQNIEKLRRCAAYGSAPLGEAAAAAIIEAVDAIETLDDTARLPALAAASRSSAPCG